MKRVKKMVAALLAAVFLAVLNPAGALAADDAITGTQESPPI